jgi:hypothetical protein
MLIRITKPELQLSPCTRESGPRLASQRGQGEGINQAYSLLIDSLPNDREGARANIALHGSPECKQEQQLRAEVSTRSTEINEKMVRQADETGRYLQIVVLLDRVLAEEATNLQEHNSSARLGASFYNRIQIRLTLLRSLSMCLSSPDMELTTASLTTHTKAHRLAFNEQVDAGRAPETQSLHSRFVIRRLRTWYSPAKLRALVPYCRTSGAASLWFRYRRKAPSQQPRLGLVGSWRK